MQALQVVSLGSIFSIAFLGLLYGELTLLYKRWDMLKIKLYYDLPAYDPVKHDPNKTFALLTYRGTHYAKWVDLKSRGISSWNVFKRG